jgi:hypothetical protein
VADNSARRNRLEKKRKNQRRKSMITWGIVGIVAAALIGSLIWNNVRPPVGEAFPIMNADHIPDGTEPEPYNSNPPTSGQHYVQPLQPGFYDEEDIANLLSPAHVSAVHNLEHGYIIFWYNCDLLTEAGCDELKSELQNYMSNSLVSKLIAFPWTSTDVPLVLTAWGRLLEMETFNSSQARNFINSNRLNAPEPNAP